MKVLYEPIPEYLVNKRHLWRSKRDEWLEKVIKEEEIYYQDVDDTGTMFNRRQLQKISEGTNIPVSVNFLYPYVNQKLAILTQSKPTFKVVGLDERGKVYSHILDKAKTHIMYSSEAVGEEEECIKNMLVLGMGISGIEEMDYYEFGKFNLQYVNLHPSLIVLDANAKKRSLKDMSGYFIEKEISLEDAKSKYQKILDIINQRRISEGDTELRMEDFAVSSGSSVPDKGKIETSGFFNKVYLAEYYDKVFTNMYFVKDVETGDIQRIFKENLEENQDFILSNAVDSEYGRFVRRNIILGNYLVGVEIKPIKDFAIKVKFFEWGGSPYKSYSMIHYTLGMQETIDKSVQLMITNGMLTNNAGYTSPKGAILAEDRNKWETIGNKPGVIKEWTPNIMGGQLLKPEREQVQNISNFYPTLIEMMKSSIQTSTGINEIVTGDPSARIDVFSSLQQYQSSAMQRIQLAMNHVNLANEQLGNVLIDYLVNNLQADQAYSFFDEKNNLQEVTVAKDLIQDFKLGRYLVLSISSEAMPTQKLAMGTELMKIAQTTSDPMDRSIYIQKAFELSDMRGFDEVQEQINVKNKLSQQIQLLEEQVKRDEELMKQYENRALLAEYNAKKAMMLSDLDTNLTAETIKSKMELEIEKLKEQIKELKKPIDKTK